MGLPSAQKKHHSRQEPCWGLLIKLYAQEKMQTTILMLWRPLYKSDFNAFYKWKFIKYIKNPLMSNWNLVLITYLPSRQICVFHQSTRQIVKQYQRDISRYKNRTTFAFLMQVRQQRGTIDREQSASLYYVGNGYVIDPWIRTSMTEIHLRENTGRKTQVT